MLFSVKKFARSGLGAWPRRCRIICFLIVTPFQIGIILTANYTFLNYLVLSLGFLLLDDGFVRSVLPQPWKKWGTRNSVEATATPHVPSLTVPWLRPVWRGVAGIYLGWVFYATTALLLAIVPHMPRLPLGPARALEPFRIANQYGLFAVMSVLLLKRLQPSGPRLPPSRLSTPSPSKSPRP